MDEKLGAGENDDFLVLRCFGLILDGIRRALREVVLLQKYLFAEVGQISASVNLDLFDEADHATLLRSRDF